MPYGCREARQAGVLHGLQAGELHEDHPGQALRSQAGSVHGHPLRAEGHLQASSGAGLLPGALLQLICW